MAACHFKRYCTPLTSRSCLSVGSSHGMDNVETSSSSAIKGQGRFPLETMTETLTNALEIYLSPSFGTDLSTSPALSTLTKRGHRSTIPLEAVVEDLTRNGAQCVIAIASIAWLFQKYLPASGGEKEEWSVKWHGYNGGRRRPPQGDLFPAGFTCFSFIGRISAYPGYHRSRSFGLDCSVQDDGPSRTDIFPSHAVPVPLALQFKHRCSSSVYFDNLNLLLPMP